MVIGDRKMMELNEKHMKHLGTTDVLSFPLGNGTGSGAGFVNPPDGILRLGDIVVSYPQAVKQAQEHSLLVDDEVCNLVQHGLLHLLGINHEENDE